MSSTTRTRSAVSAAARFGTAYGYRFNGEVVELQANFLLLNETAHRPGWALQLIASSAGSNSGRAEQHIIATVPLPPIIEIAGASEPFCVTTIATLPAGKGQFNLSLALVLTEPGQVDEVHDIAVFSQPESFTLPSLRGDINCRYIKNEVHLDIARIENPRDTANVSGTLSLELWALSQPYTGGSFEGHPLAGAILGRLTGQQSWSDLSYDLNYAAPPAGRWHVVLMLREWTGFGYTTRDYYNFAEPLIIDHTPAETGLPPEVPIPAPENEVETTVAPKIASKKTKGKKKGAKKRGK
jgi:hypothetical protein